MNYIVSIPLWFFLIFFLKMISFFILFKLGESCLHAGCKYGHTSVVEYLVSIHTKIDLQDSVSFYFLLFFFIKSCHFILSSPSWWAWSLISNDHDDDHDKSLSQARSMIIDHDDHDKYPAQRVGTAHRSWHGFPRIVELLCQARAEQKWGETS